MPGWVEFSTETTPNITKNWFLICLLKMILKNQKFGYEQGYPSYIYMDKNNNQ